MYYGNMAVIIINNNVIICILTKIDLGEGEKLTTVHIYIYCVTPLVTQNCRTLCGKTGIDKLYIDVGPRAHWRHGSTNTCENHISVNVGPFSPKVVLLKLKLSSYTPPPPPSPSPSPPHHPTSETKTQLGTGSIEVNLCLDVLRV